MKLSIIKAGTKAQDNATGLLGIITHVAVEMDGRVIYLFQPGGLSPEDGKPVKKMWVAVNRLSKLSEPQQFIDVPTEVLGTEVEDETTGFHGMAVRLCLHQTGCVHVDVQPAGRLSKTGAAVEECDFNILRLTGKALKKLSEAEIEEREKRAPSPSSCDRPLPRML